MKKKVNIIYQLLACILIFSASTVGAQTGVLTQNPSTPLHIDAANDNVATPTAAQLQNDVVVTAAGNLGVGVLAPVTKVDLRSSDQKGIIGVGENNGQTAATAGGGAMRYNMSGYLEYSDGEKWIALPLTAPEKALVNANKGSSLNIGNNSETYITGWSETIDTGSNFDTADGTFEAPRDGFYLVSFNITLASGNIANNSFIETIIETDQTTNNIPVYRTINSYPAFQGSNISNFVSGNCNAIFQLQQGDEIRFKVRHTLGGTRSVFANSELNNISISEL